MRVDPAGGGGEACLRQHGPAETVDRFRGLGLPQERGRLPAGLWPPHPCSRCSPAREPPPAHAFSRSTAFLCSSSTISCITSVLCINLCRPPHTTPESPSTPHRPFHLSQTPAANAKSSPVDFWVGSLPLVSPVALQFSAQVTYSSLGRSLFHSLVHSTKDQATS